MLGWYTLLSPCSSRAHGRHFALASTAKFKFKPANRNQARFEAMPINVIVNSIAYLE
jgi:hypothetical protein